MADAKKAPAAKAEPPKEETPPATAAKPEPAKQDPAPAAKAEPFSRPVPPGMAKAGGPLRQAYDDGAVAEAFLTDALGLDPLGLPAEPTTPRDHLVAQSARLKELAEAVWKRS